MRRTALSATALAVAALVLPLTACDAGDRLAELTGGGPTASSPAQLPDTTTATDDLPAPVHAPATGAGASPLSAAASRGTVEVMGRPQEQPPVRNSVDFEFLENPDSIQPGARYITEQSDGSTSACSFGWRVGMQSDESREFNLTAGHCGDVGDEVYVETSSGETVPVGEFVWQAFDGEPNIGTGNDYALIEFYDDVKDAITGTPQVTFDNVPVTLAGWEDAAWLQQNQPYMCRLGFKEGLSCGSFQEMSSANTVEFGNVADHGDSGGAIWAFDPADPTGSEIHAVAVTSFTDTSDATYAGGKTIDQVMDSLGLTIYG